MKARADYTRLACIEGKGFSKGWPLNWPEELNAALDELPDSRETFPELANMALLRADRKYPLRPLPQLSDFLDLIDWLRDKK